MTEAPGDDEDASDGQTGLKWIESMKGDMRRTRSIIMTMVFSTSLGVLSGCQEDDEFTAIAIDPAGRTIARNEPIRIEFSHRLRRTNPVRPLVRLTDSNGTAVPYRVLVGDRFLELHPIAIYGWPASTGLDLEVRRGRAAAFRSEDGRALAAGIKSTIRVGEHHRDDGAPFLIETPMRPGRTDALRDHVISLRFTHPVDPESLDRAVPPIRVVARAPGEDVPLVPILELDADGRTVHVHPWGDGGRFFADCEHQVLVLKRIRAVSGRVLNQQYLFSFRTSADATSEGFAVVDFSTSQLMDAGNKFLDPSFPYARPELEPIGAISVHGFDDSAVRAASSTVPFGPNPSRLQILVPGGSLGDDPALLTGFSFRVKQDIPEDLIFPRVILRLGYAAPGLADLPGSNFETNFDPDAPMIRTSAAGSARGEWRPETGQGRWVRFDLDRPFPYDGANRSIVLDILDDKGGHLTGRPEAKAGLAWIVGASPRDGTGGLLSSGNPPQIVQNLVFATKIHIERYLDIETRVLVLDVDKPEFVVRRLHQDLDATGREEVDFRFRFKGRRSDGTWTDWIGLDERLDGCREIRVKLIFLHPPEAAGGVPVEVRRLVIRYRATDSR